MEFIHGAFTSDFITQRTHTHMHTLFYVCVLHTNRDIFVGFDVDSVSFIHCNVLVFGFLSSCLGLHNKTSSGFMSEYKSSLRKLMDLNVHSQNIV